MAFLAAAPEVAAATEGAGAAEAGSAGTSRGASAAAGAPGVRRPRRKLSPKAQQQRDDIQKIKDARPKEDDPAPEDLRSGASSSTPDTGKSSADRPAPLFQVAPMQPAAAGSGVVLGALAWVVAVNYLRGGVPQVRKLLAAKFLNKTS